MDTAINSTHASGARSASLKADNVAVDPVTGLRLFELSHPWGHGVPAYPGFEGVEIKRAVSHAEHGVLSQRIRTVMHTGTHVNAPRHLVQRGCGIGELPLERFFGSGVVIDCPKEQWELVTADDLEAVPIAADDIAIIITGWHRRYADSQEYFAHAPGLSVDAAQCLVERGVKLVGIDTPHVDHPLATSLAAHRGGPTATYLPARYQASTGRSAGEDFPELNPAHRTLLTAGIPTIENVGGEVDSVLGRRVTLHAMPWRWADGDACPVRLAALVDPDGACRIEQGESPGEAR
jgi:kynurenine formamidase